MARQSELSRAKAKIESLQSDLTKARATLLTARGWVVANHDRLNAKWMMDKINDTLPYGMR